MWSPTHVQVTVKKARGLLTKGKNGTNDAYVIIALGKEKFQTSVKDKATDTADWHEECELQIPRQGNKADITLTVLHRNFIGDEFLGQVSIPLAEFDVYDKPKNAWYELKSKPGHEKKNKYRGEIEVKINFTVHSGVVNNATSLADINKKEKEGLRGSFSSLSHKMGGSLLSLGKEKKGSIRNLAKAVGHKVSTLPGRGKKNKKDKEFGTIPEFGGLSPPSSNNAMFGNEFTKVNSNSRIVKQERADPGVISDDEDEDEFKFEELSHHSSHSSLSVSQVALGGSTPTSNKGSVLGSVENLGGGVGVEVMTRKGRAPQPPTINVPKDDRPQPILMEGSTPPLGSGPSKPKRWSEPVDDWEAKLFGKNQFDRKSDTFDVFNSRGRHEKIDVGDEEPPTKPNKTSSSPSSSPSVIHKHPEPVPRPRHGHHPQQNPQKSEEIPNSQQTPNNNNHSNTIAIPIPTNNLGSSPSAESLHQLSPSPASKAKESLRATMKESLASIFGGGSSSKGSTDDSDHTHNQKDHKGTTPIAVTNPIRQNKDHNNQHHNNHHHHIPRDALKKYESKSRADLIEIILNQQATLDYQKQKLGDMEDYIDNLVARVIETHPTLLQSPFVTRHTLK